LTKYIKYDIVYAINILLEVIVIILIEDIIKEISNPKIDCSINELKIQLRKINGNGNILIVGTGGSYISALYAKCIIEKNMQNLCEVLTPMEAMQGNVNLFSYVIIYSYKMKSYEINKVIQETLECENIKKIILITSNNAVNIINNKIKYIFYDTNHSENTYVSLKGIYYPAYLLINCFNTIKINNTINSIKIDYIKDSVIDIFYDKYSYYLAVLIERHFCELGIVTVRLHEKKDFSHGRMNIINGNDIIYFKSFNYEEEYDDLLLDYLKNIKKCRVLNIEELKNNFNNFEEILIWLKWIIQIANYKKVDIYNKKDTKEDKKLFKYKEGRL